MTTFSHDPYLEERFDNKQKAIVVFEHLLQRIRIIVDRDSIEPLIHFAEIGFGTNDHDEYRHYSPEMVDLLTPHLTQLEENLSKIANLKDEIPYFDFYMYSLAYVMEYVLDNQEINDPPGRLLLPLIQVNGFLNEMRDSVLHNLQNFISSCSEYKHVLHEKRRLLLRADSYGFVNDQEWRSEKTNFSVSLLSQFGGDADTVIGAMLTKTLIHHAIDSLLDDMDGFGEVIENENGVISPHAIGVQYEQECIELFSENGWIALDTPVSGDKGADIIASKRGIRIVVQCKKWAQKAGTSAVQEIASAKIFYEADFAVLLNENGITSQAEDIANKLGIITASKEDISDLEILIIKRHLSQR